MGNADWYEIVPNTTDIMWNPVTLQNKHPIIFENNMREQREGINKKQFNQLTLFQQNNRSQCEKRDISKYWSKVYTNKL